MATARRLQPTATTLNRTAQARGGHTARKTYVLDTSVLLSDPRALCRFAEHAVVLPVAVITELEGKRHHPELGYFAGQVLRILDDLRVRAGRLDVPVPIGDAGGTLQVLGNWAHPADGVGCHGYPGTGDHPAGRPVRRPRDDRELRRHRARDRRGDHAAHAQLGRSRRRLR